MATEFVLPELGENIDAGEIVRVLVKPGDTTKKDQPVVELETDKATIEVPSTFAGVVKEVRVKTGDKVKVGAVILIFDETPGATVASALAASPAEPPAPPPASAPPPAAAAEPEPIPRARRGEVVDISRGTRPQAEAVSAASSTPEPAAPAAPSVRRLARELGVDIDAVRGTGDEGRISIQDVKDHARQLISVGPVAGARPGGVPAEPLPEFSRWGEVERKPMSGIRRKTAEHLSVAWASIPHVTQCDVADITALEELRQRYAQKVEAAGGTLTVTVIALKFVAAALKVFPQFNASVDMAAREVVLKKYVHIGVAVDTDRGLLVPVVRDADKKSITELSIELARLAERARTRELTLEEMQGGCFSISNLGGIGGTSFTPIVNAPEVAILGISRGSWQPVYSGRGGAGGEFVPKLMLPLSLSYDHRVIDGADAVRFLRWLVEAFQQPFLLSLEG